MKPYFILFLFLAVNVNAQDANPTAEQQESKSTTLQVDEMDPEIEQLKRQYDLLKLRNAILSTKNVIQSEQHRKELMELHREKETLQLLS